MKNFFQKQREIIIVIAYIVVILMLVYFVIFPLLSKIEEVNNQIQEESTKQEIIRQQIGELPKIQQQYDALQQNEESINVLLDKNKAVNLIERLEKIAQDSGNKIEISVQDSQSQKNVVLTTTGTDQNDALVSALPNTDYLQMQIILTGDYNKIVDFVSMLESMEYYSDIIGVKISQNNSTADAGVVNPFSSGLSTNSEKKSSNYNAGDLEATINVVFYTKK